MLVGVLSEGCFRRCFVGLFLAIGSKQTFVNHFMKLKVGRFLVHFALTCDHFVVVAVVVVAAAAPKSATTGCFGNFLIHDGHHIESIKTTGLLVLFGRVHEGIFIVVVIPFNSSVIFLWRHAQKHLILSGSLSQAQGQECGRGGLLIVIRAGGGVAAVLCWFLLIVVLFLFTLALRLFHFILLGENGKFETGPCSNLVLVVCFFLSFKNGANLLQRQGDCAELLRHGLGRPNLYRHASVVSIIVGL
mmetsp:Transcript_11483/g.31778  ORF Transcript_11483/g.31778 Transcript_11483/m.31778 type:complete len:246 (-) Transcript_11483:456-1193(-)